MPIDWDNRATESASYISQANVWIKPNPTPPWSTEGLRAQIAHEIGHIYGLDEKYIEPNICNDNERAIMDIVRADVNPQVHCDNITGPTELDVNNAKRFWGIPTVGLLKSDLPMTGYANGSVATFYWHDLAWSEKMHQLRFYWWDNSINDWQLITAATANTSAYIGSHMYTSDRALGWTFNRNSYGMPPGYYRACAWAWFQAAGQFGNGRCSLTVQLS